MLQEHKQHHVHVLNSKGERVPLTHSRRRDDPKKRKGEFPRSTWLCDSSVVLCQGLLHAMKIASSGRRDKLGSLHGPMNEENLNGTHPALLVGPTASGGAFNSDVQLPYRMPICEATHSRTCDKPCIERFSAEEVIDAAQSAQDAQAGYACDYQNKRGPCAFNEVMSKAIVD